jgi:small subunit ribosomal protein S6
MSKNFYELTYIIDPVLDEDQFQSVIDKFTRVLSDNDASVEEVDDWGIRKFAYEMDKKSNGYYVNAYFEADPDVIAKLERELRIDDRIMRYLTLKYDAKMKRHRELRKKGEVPNIFQEEED